MGWPSLSGVTNALSDTYHAARNTVRDGVDTVSSIASTATHAVTATVSSVASTAAHTVSSGAAAVHETASRAADFGRAALDRAGDLGQAGLDAGRHGIEAVQNVDVREAAATARSAVSTATEAARDGISTATTWSSERVGDAADWARSNVTGDDFASQALRGAITQAEQSTRFDLGVVGGVTREVVSTVGAAGQLAVTSAEIQASPEAALEYGTAIVNGIGDAGRATGSYLESVANDPGRLGSDIGGAWNSASGFVDDTVHRYGTAIAEGRTEEIGMDVGAALTYVVPVGGGPVRGALTAAVREGGELAVRGTAEALVRGGTQAVVRDGTQAVVRDGANAVVRDGAQVAARSGAEAAEQRGAALLARIEAGGGTAALPNGAGRVADIAAAARQSGREVAIYRDAATGQRQVTIGAADGVTVPGGSRLIAHTQPGVGAAALTPSVADRAALGALGQRSSAIIDGAGTIQRFDGPVGSVLRDAEQVPLQAPRHVTTPQGGSIDYGALDDLGRPTGVQAHITQDMISTGTPANSTIHPPGWSGDGRLYNEARGHLLGRQLGGSGDLPENLVTLQQRPANTPVMSGFEGEVRRAVEGGQVVDYSSTPVYASDALVPRGVTLTGQGSDGFRLDVTVLNPAYKP